ncbi:MAG: SET domain-containing protein-lysine N-methyltransferase [Thermoguttaceae bacterium]
MGKKHHAGGDRRSIAAADRTAGGAGQSVSCHVADYGRQGVRVGDSPNGLGVFSLRQFGRDELLGPIEGRIMDDAMYESDYCMELGNCLALEPAAPFRYVNHSCHPNCELVELNRQDGTRRSRLWLKVNTAITAGVELTIDYAWPAEVATPCRCGCADCRRWIVAADEVDRIGR